MLSKDNTYYYIVLFFNYQHWQYCIILYILTNKLINYCVILIKLLFKNIIFYLYFKNNNSMLKQKKLAVRYCSEFVFI